MARAQTALAEDAIISLEMSLLLAAFHLGDDSPAHSTKVLHSRVCDPLLQWETVLRLASWHGVSSLLAQRLRTAGLAPKVPAHAWILLERQARERSLLAMTHVAALGEIERAMQQAGIPILAWKGPALSMELHGSYALRASSDLDFLLAHDHMEEAILRLAEVGFVRVSEWTRDDARDRAAHLSHEVQMVRARDRLSVELHDEVMPELFGKGLAMHRCIDRARWLTLDARVRTRVLAREDLFLSLCAHGAKHGWERLKWVCDIAAFVERYRSDLNWAEILTLARSAAALEALLCGVRLAEQLLGVRQPEVLQQWTLQKTAVQRVVHVTAVRLASGSMEPKSARAAMRDALDTLVTRRAQTRYLVRRALTIAAVDVESFQVPGKLAAVRYPLRALRVAVRMLGPKSGNSPGPRKPPATQRERRPVRLNALLLPRNLALGTECVLALVLARIGLKMAKLPSLSRNGCRIFESLVPGPAVIPSSAVFETASWIHRTSQFLPGMLCLQQALAAQWMLARRGSACTLHVGVATSGAGFRSHAWLTYRDRVLLGGRQAPKKYREILRCDSANPSGDTQAAAVESDCPIPVPSARIGSR